MGGNLLSSLRCQTILHLVHASKVLWVFAVASPDGRAFLQLLLDLDSLRFCLRGSSIRGEVCFNTPKHLVCGGPRIWHHVVLTHARPKSRLLGTRDKLSLWVDGELVDTVKVKRYLDIFLLRNAMALVE